MSSTTAEARSPISWETDDGAFWAAERLHFTDPMTPMDWAFMRDAHDQVNWALARYELPIRYHFRLINRYWFFAIRPLDLAPEELQAMGRRGQANLEAAVARLRQLWDGEWLPEVQQHLAYWETFDLRRAPMAALLEHFRATIARSKRVWQIHFLQTFPVYLAMSLLDELYRDLFGAAGELDPYRLLQGFENKTVEAGRAGWRLSRRALASEPVHRTFATREPAEVVPALEASRETRWFLGELRTYLGDYGQRGEKLGVSYPSAIEDPTPVIKDIRNHLLRPEHDFDAALAALAAERERLVADLRAKLAGYPAPVVAELDSLLATAQAATAISEDHSHYIDFRCMYQVRRVLLELGRRLAEARLIERVDDAFYLSPQELTEAAEARPGIDRRQLVAACRREIESVRAIQPPPAIGAPPAGPPPDDPLARAMGKFFGAPPAPPESTDEGGVLRGNAGSRGRARGVARVIRSLAEAARLRPGEVLVAETTAPPWTPLFATAAAVVTDAGGILSHCAVVAREYGIPAVVGTGMASVLIHDGQEVEVDGDAGIVRVLAAS
ncbi:MAG TPA: PEP-utilizing enzyme [Chloroflexota bacterium]|nr:PEP-utilizing enzyme [Chloroflexota bacterium]